MLSSIPDLISEQRSFYNSKITHDLNFRKKTLKVLRDEVKKREKDIQQALFMDFKKCSFEAALSETGIVIKELDLIINNLKKWSRPKRVFPSLLNFPSTDTIYKEPYGTVLVIAPWNYPFQLAISPLIGAVAAGNTVVLKPSELTSNTATILGEIVSAVFTENHVAVVKGGVDIATHLLEQRWDYIFFTGSVPVGKIVAKAAAKYLTPVTLELGGKSPCIIDASARLQLAAKRLVWGKFLNGGQTCIAPDYLLIEASVKSEFIKYFREELLNAYGNEPQESPDFPRIVNERNFDRLYAMLQGHNIVIGGKTDKEDLYIAPSVVDEPDLDSSIMQEEIFGPLLPIISFRTYEDLDKIINMYEKPLSFYIFSNKSRFIHQLIQSFSFGGGVINDSLIHFGNHRLPFGGVGHSGMGAYHGRDSFDSFTHKKGVVKKGNWLDIPIRYAPYKGKLKSLKFFFKYFK